MKITLTVVTSALFGRPKTEEKEVEIEPSGASLAEVLTKAGVPTKGMQISVDGEPVSETNLHLKNGAKIQLTNAKSKRPKPRVQVTERASGS